MSGRSRYVWDKERQTWTQAEKVVAASNNALGSAGWPMCSDAAGVLPRQIPDAIEEAKRKGVPTEFTRDGRPILTSLRHQRLYNRAIGLNQRNSFLD